MVHSFSYQNINSLVYCKMSSDSFEGSGVDEFGGNWFEPIVVEAVAEPSFMDPSSSDHSAPELDLDSPDQFSSEDSSLSFGFYSLPLDFCDDRIVLPNELSLEAAVLSSPFDTSDPYDIHENHLNGNQYTVYPDLDQNSYPNDMNFNPNQDQQSTDESIEDYSIEDESKESHVAGSSTGCKTRRAKHLWSEDENHKLRSLVDEYGCERKKISKLMGDGLTAKQCREHYNRMTKNINKNAWNDKEKAILRTFREGIISEEELYMRLNRSKKQIKERLEIENKNLAPWSPEELGCLMALMKTYGKAYGEIKSLMKSLYGYDRSYQQVRCKVIAIRKKQKHN